MKKVMMAAGMLLFALSVLAFAAGVDGKWTGSVLGPDGNNYQLKYIFKTDGEKLTGTSETVFGVSPLENGKATATEISFDVNVNGTILTHKGKIYPDSIALDMDYNGTPMHTVLKKVVE